jgi:hypothetical protein
MKRQETQYAAAASPAAAAACWKLEEVHEALELQLPRQGRAGGEVGGEGGQPSLRTKRRREDGRRAVAIVRMM